MVAPDRACPPPLRPSDSFPVFECRPRFFQPFGSDDVSRSCTTCRHSIGWDSVHVFCQRARIVSVNPCGHWEREAGCD